MKLLEQVTGTVSALGADGKGLLHNGGKDVHVQFAVPGDEITATLVKRRKGELFGRLDAVRSPSADRITPRCPHAGMCGGCPLQMLGYEAQKRWKREIVARAFKDAGADIELPQVRGATELFYHRNRMDYVIAADDAGKPVIGLKEPGRWWRTLPLTTCFMLSEDAVELTRRVRDWLAEHHVAPWDVKTHDGFARYLVIREGKNTDERMAILVTAEGDIPARDAFLRATDGLATTVYRAVNPSVTDLSIGERYELLAGAPSLREMVNGKTYRIPPQSFFQTNTAGAAMLAETVADLTALGGAETVLDLYCGVGFFSLQLADRAKRVIGIELDPEAILAARANAEENDVTNAEFLAEPAEALSWEREKPDVVIVDPPRAGLHPKVLALLVDRLPPRIVYVSCNPRRLAAELPAFLERYRLADIRLLDLFPHTPHVEAVASFVRK